MNETTPLGVLQWISRLQTMEAMLLGVLDRLFAMRVHLVEHHIQGVTAGRDAAAQVDTTLQSLLEQMDALEALVPGQPPYAKA